ncbi:polyketide cyclase [Pandoraea cepalis]|uniref:Polyketide cyclase n=2 Tax=Pandoraea cepalis TaxID=2508294 RepID=A0AAW7MHX4_9BURK|nr:SRPBCC family protein [Pandoraea cepalis]MDN4572228.1 polyketide cyclase [Pandoraea cepalis]MDN4578462.1 polyketide cyclase [Pandoraea cepalis]
MSNSIRLPVHERAPMKRVFLFFLGAAVVVALLSLLPLPFERQTHIVSTVTVQAPPQAVYDYVTTPANWPKWHPASLAVQGATDHSLVVGEKVAEEFRLAGRHGIIHWKVVEAKPPLEWRLEGEMNRRPSGEVRYTLTPDGTGTRFERDVVYRTPNLLLLMLDPIFIGPRMRAESAQGAKQLEQIFATATADTPAPASMSSVATSSAQAH